MEACLLNPLVLELKISMHTAPYALNGGGRRGFATLFYLIPLTILSVSLFESFQSSCLTTSSTRQIFFVPVTFLIALTFVAGIQSPNSLKESRRVVT